MSHDRLSELRAADLEQRAKTKVLIVEDELPLAFLMVAALTQAGCDVEAVHTSKKALKIASENKFDLIALDLKLPDASGFDLCSELKQRDISRNTPIIFVSGSINPEDIAESKRRGGVDYITKPFDVIDFIYRIVFHARAENTSLRGNRQSRTADLNLV